ncbi:hypothetical protein FQ775_09390 [Nitratireductor mangrovi]|uniref:Uncharacterized protein n=1 Tax=Nitratireductor mangrovi TaxID=2599600 RepID=A0A5B8KXV7_9HYPH|nr:hypothetical protein [Nitratireductor mangrovi]QDZ00577.1 hypothetical protein FQ775_09390 [Nitratireductor mangrovi]
MFRFLKTAALASMIGVGAIGATAGTAQADGLSIGFGGSGGHFSMYFGDGGRHWHSDRRWGKGRHFRRGCTPWRAVNKARHMGVRHARVVRANHRIIKVRGRKFGHRVNIVFARAPHCPVLNW